MRLIDADALKKYVKQQEDYDSSYTICAYIDNAPTVDITETISNFRNTAYRNGFTTGLNKRPQAEPCYKTSSCLDCKNYDKEHFFLSEILRGNQRGNKE